MLTQRQTTLAVHQLFAGLDTNGSSNRSPQLPGFPRYSVKTARTKQRVQNRAH